MIRVFFLVLFIVNTFAVDLMKHTACVTPLQENATCVPLYSCNAIISILTTFTNEVVQFAKDSKCGCEEGTVCCGTLKYKSYPPLINCAPVPQAKISLSPVSDSSVCGLQSSTDKIIGGSLLKADECPWLVAVEYEQKFTKQNAGIRCGGSIITKRFILTAAHCILDVEFEIIKVWLGVGNITTDEICYSSNGKQQCINTVQKLNVAKTIPHELYNMDKFNDIGLLQLEADIEYSNYIRPICLPSKLSVLPSIGTQLTVAGWGITETGTRSEVKLKVKVPLKDNKICKDYLKKHFNDITPKQLCVGGDRGMDSCDGDSGGPLMYEFQGTNDDIQWSQQGIVSYGGSGCGIRGKPGVYTKVSSYSTWIYNKIINKTDNLEKDEPCTTPNGTIGTCVQINTCPSIYKSILTKSAYYSYQNELGKYQCSVYDSNLLVCCEDPGSRISNNFNTSPLPDKTTCGILKKEHGFKDNDNLVDFPWIVGIEVSSTPANVSKIRCIGTVINSRYVLTTVSCIFGKESDTFQPINVWLGHWNSSRHNDCKNCTIQKVGIKKIIPYPLSIPWLYTNNALLLLENAIIFSDYISPICLFSGTLPQNGIEVNGVFFPSQTEAGQIPAADKMSNEKSPVIACYNSPFEENPDDDWSYRCTTAQDQQPSGAPIMRRYEDKPSGTYQWYLLTAPPSNNLYKAAYVFYTDSINDYLDWILTIISEYN